MEYGPGPFPTLYLSHGYGDNDASWSGAGKAHWILDALIASGRCKPMLVVMPDAHILPLPREPFDFFESYITPNTEAFCRDLEEDLRPLIERHYPVEKSAKGRAFAGLSMGGHHALAVALNLNAHFRFIGAFSAVPPGSSLSSKGLSEPQAVNRNLDLLWVGCGRDDFLFQRNLDFRESLVRAGIRFEFAETEGNHSWPVWRRYLVEFVPRLF
jgi:enterochelin esterase family protein